MKCEFCGTLFQRTSGPQNYCSLPCRFWSKVDCSGGPSACWPWIGTRHGKGYGHFKVEQWVEKAHRLAWILANGSLPQDDLLVLHRCDNPPCCNPAHFVRANLQVWPNIVAQDERVRLIRIDTPEVHAKQQCERDLALKATAYTKQRLSEAKVIEVRVQRGQARDSFGRILGEVFVDGVSLNDELLSTGLARKYGVSTPWC